MNFGEEEEAGTGLAGCRGPKGEEELNQPPDQGCRKRSRSREVEMAQDSIPMEVDQEGAEDQAQGDDHGTEQENMGFADQQQYDEAPEGGWNHEAVEI
eukprot:13411858-Heterocapsa_arctica.AAC.1